MENSETHRKIFRGSLLESILTNLCQSLIMLQYRRIYVGVYPISPQIAGMSAHFPTPRKVLIALY